MTDETNLSDSSTGHRGNEQSTMHDPTLTQDTHSDVLESAASIDRETHEAKDGLKPLQAEWVRNYVGPARFVAAEASRLTGVNERTGRGWRDRADVRRYCAALIKREAYRIMITKTALIQELAFIGFSDIAELFEVGIPETDGSEPTSKLRDVSTLPRHLSRAIKKIKFDEDGNVTEITFHDKLKALQLLGIAWQLFDGKLTGEGEGKGEIWTGFNIIAPSDKQEDREA
jgi:hypothetical protein